MWCLSIHLACEVHRDDYAFVKKILCIRSYILHALSSPRTMLTVQCCLELRACQLRVVRWPSTRGTVERELNALARHSLVHKSWTPADVIYRNGVFSTIRLLCNIEAIVCTDTFERLQSVHINGTQHVTGVSVRRLRSPIHVVLGCLDVCTSRLGAACRYSHGERRHARAFVVIWPHRDCCH